MVTQRGIAHVVITDHARFEMSRRGIEEEVLRAVLSAPEQTFQVRPGRIVLQSKFVMEPEEREYLVRVFVDIDRAPAEVVTVYRTSKIEKYWKEQS